MLWDVFCRVIDFHGDLGVCWRLCADLASRGQTMRLWVDDPRALAWMAPEGAPGVSVITWDESVPDVTPGQVVVEAFGCSPPAAFVARMAQARPVWINLEYLSAEDYVERSHSLPSPQPNGLTKWFFFPGFTPRTGGLLREAHALDPGARTEGLALLNRLGITTSGSQRRVSLFSYDHAPFTELFDRLDTEPTLLLVAAGAGQPGALAAAAARTRRQLQVQALPWLTQRDYDRLLAACDLNFARGEDSIVRAMWAGAPFVWHIYRQSDGAHTTKLDALLSRMGADDMLGRLWRAWNGLGPWPARWPTDAAWRTLCLRWRDQLTAQADLSTALLQFVAAKAGSR